MSVKGFWWRPFGRVPGIDVRTVAEWRAGLPEESENRGGG
jgi:hypothetical protein